MSKGGGKKPAPVAVDPNPPGSAGNFTSGFDPYPRQGFNLAPAPNYWSGNNFMMPGVSGSQPAMTSNLASQFPGLASILAGVSPQGAQDYSPQFTGGINSPRVPGTTTVADNVKNKRVHGHGNKNDPRDSRNA